MEIEYPSVEETINPKYNSIQHSDLFNDYNFSPSMRTFKKIEDKDKDESSFMNLSTADLGNTRTSIKSNNHIQETISFSSNLRSRNTTR